MGNAHVEAPPELAPAAGDVRVPDRWDLAALRAVVERIGTGFNADLLTAPAAVTAFADAVAVCNMMAAVRTALAARVADSTAWQAEGATSAAAWVASESGTSAGQAREVLATAARLRQLPATAAAARRGELSPEQVAVLSDAAIAAPARERELLELAGREGLGRLRESCLRFKVSADVDPAGTYRRQRAARRLVRRVDGEGMWNLYARTTADDGARIDTALAPLVERIFRAARRDGRREPEAAFAMDALVELACGGPPADPLPGAGPPPAGVFGQRGPDAGTPDAGTPDAGTPDAGTPDSAGPGSLLPEPARQRPGVHPERFLAVLRADLSALTRGGVDGAEVCEIDGVGPVPVCRARELLGEAVLKLVITKGTAVRHVTHLGRGPRAAQKIALLWEQPVCQVAGCGRRARLEVDHNIRWADRQVTELANLDRLCSQHHAMKSTHNWGLVAGTGRRPMVPPSHPDHPG